MNGLQLWDIAGAATLLRLHEMVSGRVRRAPRAAIVQYPCAVLEPLRDGLIATANAARAQHRATGCSGSGSPAEAAGTPAIHPKLVGTRSTTRLLPAIDSTGVTEAAAKKRQGGDRRKEYGSSCPHPSCVPADLLETPNIPPPQRLPPLPHPPSPRQPPPPPRSSPLERLKQLNFERLPSRGQAPHASAHNQPGRSAGRRNIAYTPAKGRTSGGFGKATSPGTADTISRSECIVIDSDGDSEQAGTSAVAAAAGEAKVSSQYGHATGSPPSPPLPPPTQSELQPIAPRGAKPEVVLTVDSQPETICLDDNEEDADTSDHGSSAAHPHPRQQGRMDEPQLESLWREPPCFVEFAHSDSASSSSDEGSIIIGGDSGTACVARGGSRTSRRKVTQRRARAESPATWLRPIVCAAPVRHIAAELLTQKRPGKSVFRLWRITG